LAQQQLSRLDSIVAGQPPAKAFEECVREGLADSVVILDAEGRVAYLSVATIEAPADAPVDPDWLRAERLEFAGNSAPEAAEAYRHKLTRNGQEIPLTTKEYRMLEYFVRRPNRTLARSDIIDQVWGRSVIVTSRSVDRCITTLRSKIEPDPRKPVFIHTIRDIGYRFELPE
jgi:hypothetical protein